jgi:hypothetical protein
VYKIYFPLFDHVESSSNEMRLTHEGLLAHPQVTLVDGPERADYVIFCQNHLVDHCPFHSQFRPIKDRYKERTILLDYDDDPGTLIDAADFRWKLYFKRSCVDRAAGRVVDYGGLPVIPTAYCVVDDMAEPPAGLEGTRPIDVSCLFDDSVIESPWFKQGRGRLLGLARRLAATHRLTAQLGPVSESGPEGRSRIHPAYKRCLFDSRVVLHANPDPWEGDARTWEALASGALLFVDRMHAPIANPLIDGRHLVFYDLTEEGLATLEEQVLYYLGHEAERERIGRAGREFVLTHHRSINRANAIVDALSRAASGPAISTTRSAPVDLVVTIATGYDDLGDFRRFIATLRRTGATCPVLIGISEGPAYEHVRRYLAENGVNYVDVPPLPRPGMVVNGYRFALYRRWLRDLDFRYALMLDFRDAFFQRDPFADADAIMDDCDLYLMSEFQLLTVKNHPNGMNYAWVAEPFGIPAAESIGDEVILNSGAILGTRNSVMDFLDACAAVSAEQDYAFADQGTLNYLAHTGRLDHCGRIKVTRAGMSVVNNCGFTEVDLLEAHRPITADEAARIAFIPRNAQGRLQLYRDDDGWVLDDDGNVSYVVHQYDRFYPEIGDFVEQLASHQHPERVFVNSGLRPYRAETYTLSSRAGLAPGAVRRLIDTIKSVPLDKKPLLLIDACFKRGFVFAYGILNIDLLFEPEEFRRHFFEASRDSAKCDRFCRRWGYEPVLVEEADIFLPLQSSVSAHR